MPVDQKGRLVPRDTGCQPGDLCRNHLRRRHDGRSVAGPRTRLGELPFETTVDEGVQLRDVGRSAASEHERHQPHEATILRGQWRNRQKRGHERGWRPFGRHRLGRARWYTKIEGLEVATPGRHEPGWGDVQPISIPAGKGQDYRFFMLDI